MKTVTIAAWYVSVALGNLMVIIITQARLFKSQVMSIIFKSTLQILFFLNNACKILSDPFDLQAHEFFFFAGLILTNMLIFALMVGRYSFVVLEADSSMIPAFTRADSGERREGEKRPLLQGSAGPSISAVNNNSR